MPCDIPGYHKDIDLVLNRKIRREGYFKIIDEDNSIVLQKSKRLYK
jgi:hypothetical protein